MDKMFAIVFLLLAIIALASIGENEYQKKTDPVRKWESDHCIYPPEYGVVYPDELIRKGRGCVE